MTSVTLDGRVFAITPGGLVSVAYKHPAQPGLTLWRRMTYGSQLSRRVRVAAGLESKPVPPKSRLKSSYYADRHCI